MPSAPQSIYFAEWKGWGHFLGTDNYYSKEWLSYNEAKLIVQRKRFANQNEFFKFIRKTENTKFIFGKYYVWKYQNVGHRTFIFLKNRGRTIQKIRVRHF